MEAPQRGDGERRGLHLEIDVDGNAGELLDELLERRRTPGADLLEGALGDAAGIAEDPRSVGIVGQHQHAVGSHVCVGLQSICAELHRPPERGQRVLGKFQRGAAVGVDAHGGKA